VGNRLEGTARRAGPKTVAAILFATHSVWGALGAIEAAQGPVEAEDGRPPRGFLGLLDLDAEYDVPAILGATYWLLAGIVLALAGRAREVARGRRVWTALSVMLVYLAADEALGIHEKLEGRQASTGSSSTSLSSPPSPGPVSTSSAAVLGCRGCSSRALLSRQWRHRSSSPSSGTATPRSLPTAR
jgi:hypothetical protein